MQGKFSFLLCGESGVGKSQIFDRLQNKDFSDSAKTTIGTDLEKLVTNVKVSESSQVTLEINLWDASGAPRYRRGNEVYLPQQNAVAIVLDALPTLDTQQQQEAMARIDGWYEPIREKAPNAAIYFLVNKIDLIDNFNSEAGDAWRQANIPEKYRNVPVLFCSAKENVGVKEAFQVIAKDYCKKNPPQMGESKATQPISSSPSGSVWLWEEKVQYIGNVVCAAALVTLLIVASFPVGGVFAFGFGISALAGAAIIGGAAFLLWNAGCLIANAISARLGDGLVKIDNDYLSNSTMLTTAEKTANQTVGGQPVYGSPVGTSLQTKVPNAAPVVDQGQNQPQNNQ